MVSIRFVVGPRGRRGTGVGGTPEDTRGGRRKPYGHCIFMILFLRKSESERGFTSKDRGGTDYLTLPTKHKDKKFKETNLKNTICTSLYMCFQGTGEL